MSDSSPVTVSPWRLRIVVVGIAVVALSLGARALQIQVMDNQFLQDQGDARHLRIMSLPAHRGMILDRNGESLAVSTPVASIWANPQSVNLDDDRLNELATLIGRTPAQLKKSIRQRQDREFIYLKRHVDPSIENEIAALEIPGIAVQREYRRYYPAAEVSGHVLGFTNVDDVGQEGLELAFDDLLRGKPGKQRVVKDRLGHVIDATDLLVAPQPGANVELSIDRRLQYIAYRELKRAVQVNNAKSGSLVLLDATTGEILAMVNQPTFNPNNRRTLKASMSRNRAVTDLFEPGSTMKPFTVTAALKSKLYSPDTMIDTSPGRFRIGPNTITDFRNYGVINVSRVIEKSSNIGVSKMALEIPKEMMWETLSDLGFGETTGSQFPGESAGSLPFFGEWKDIERATLSFGYGLAVTPLQLAQAYTVFANEGRIRPLSFLKVVQPAMGKRVLDRDNVAAVLKMLETVVESNEGTGTAARIPGYRVAGKTGTVKKSGKGGYIDNSYRAVFAGVAPASQPRLVSVVVIDEPRGDEYYGGKVAAPVFANVMAAALRLMNIAPDNISPEQWKVPVHVAKAMNP